MKHSDILTYDDKIGVNVFKKNLQYGGLLLGLNFSFTYMSNYWPWMTQTLCVV